MKHLQYLLLLSFSVGTTSAISYGTCTAGTTFYCPTSCEDDGMVTDCSECPGYMSSDRDHKICIDRRLFQPHNTDPNDHENHYHYLWNDLVGALVWFITAGVSIACGVGGGGIYVPLGILLFGFAPKQSSGFSQASIFGAGLAGLILNSRNHHPNKSIRHDVGVVAAEDDSKSSALTRQVPLNATETEEYKAAGGILYSRPLVNYDMALFMSPMQMAGAVLGVLVQKILPNWLYLLFAGIVLSYTSYKTYKKYFASRKLEVEKQRAQEDKCSNSEPESESSENLDDPYTNGTVTLVNLANGQLLDASSHHPDVVMDDAAVEEDAAGSPQEASTTQEAQDGVKENDKDCQLRKQYLEEDMRQYPKEKIGALIFLWIGLFVLTLMKGGKGVKSLVGVECDSPWYAVLIVCQFLWLFGFAAVFGRKLMKDQQARRNVQYPFLEEDPVWDAPSMRFYGCFCFASGVVAALIGIGGGMVLGPLMLVMGINPRVSTATNATMIVVTSSSVAVIFVTSGLVPWSYALFYFAVCFAGSWLGKSKIDAYVKKTGRSSMLIFILASIIAFATVGCIVILLTRLVEKEWCFDDFNKFCTVGDDEDCPIDQLLNTLSGASNNSSSMAIMGEEADLAITNGDW